MTSGPKKCRECGVEGPDDLFAQGRKGKPWCKRCYNGYYLRRRKQATPEQRAARDAYMKDWRERNPDYRWPKYKQWEAHIWRNYGLTIDDHQALIKQHDNRCAICGVKGTEDEPLCIDHCHTNGHVRGLLCSKHNRGLGQFNDDVAMLENAIAYLKRGSTPALQTPLDGAKSRGVTQCPQ